MYKTCLESSHCLFPSLHNLKMNSRLPTGIVQDYQGLGNVIQSKPQ
jgi:hypothetical protein